MEYVHAVFWLDSDDNWLSEKRLYKTITYHNETKHLALHSVYTIWQCPLYI